MRKSKLSKVEQICILTPQAMLGGARFEIDESGLKTLTAKAWEGGKRAKRGQEGNENKDATHLKIIKRYEMVAAKWGRRYR
jgi:hypothetical protein